MEDDAARQPADTTNAEDQHLNPPPPEDDAPLGWERLIPGRRVFRLSSSHPDFPTEWLAKYIEGEYRRLDQSGEAAVAVAALRDIWDKTERTMRAPGIRFDTWREHWDTRRLALEYWVERLPISNRATRRAYLVDRAYPDPLTTLAGPSPPVPFEIVVNHDETSHYEELSPGEILIRLTDTPTRHLTREFMTFVAEAQQAILGHKQRGRPPDTETTQQVAAARQLSDLTAWEIAGALDIRSNTRDATRRKIARAEQQAARQDAIREQEIAQALEAERQAWEAFRRQQDKKPDDHEGGQ